MADVTIEPITSTVQKCPYCGSMQPKVVKNTLKTNWSEFILLVLFTFGVSLFFVHKPKEINESVANCSECNKTFTLDEI